MAIKNTSKYPDTFKLKYPQDPKHTGYGVTWNDNTGEFIIVHAGHLCCYSMDFDFVKNWGMVMEHECSGVDASGFPLNFTVDMLQPFMRGVTTHSTYIVVPNQSKCYDAPLVFADNAGFIVELEGSCSEHTINEIYAHPDYNQDMCNPDAKGELVWKRVNPAKEKAAKELKERKAYLQKEIKDLQEVLDNLGGE